MYRTDSQRPAHCCLPLQPQNEEVMYAKLKFEKTETKPAPASEVVYAEIKSQQK